MKAKSFVYELKRTLQMGITHINEQLKEVEIA